MGVLFSGDKGYARLIIGANDIDIFFKKFPFSINLKKVLLMEITTLGVAAAGGLIKPLIGDIYNYATSKIRPSGIKQAYKALTAMELGKQVYKTINVKTLWNVEKEVSLFEFYYPSRVTFPGHEEPSHINSIRQLPNDGRFVIQGTAGQGKSIFLRFLYGQTIFENNKINKVPLFIELRRLTSDTNLISLITGALRRFGLPATKENIEDYLSNEKIILLLDAFDEIDTELIGRTIGELEEIASLHESLPIIITARPNSSIQQCAFFRVAHLDTLNSRDHLPFLQKVCANKTQAKAIHAAIESNEGSHLQSLLSTPMLLTLLVLLYRAHSTFPSTLARFYEQLFDVMFFKHDQTKPGFHRTRHTNLDEIQLKQLFEAFSFQARVNEHQIFTNTTFESTINEAMLDTGVNVSPMGFKKELVKTACLLIEEGLELTFIHKSVAEFYAASFVQRSGNEFAIDFYNQIVTEGLQMQWAGELNFLIQIDPYRISKYFIIPQANHILKYLEISSPESDIPNSNYLKTLKRSVQINYEKRNGKWIFIGILGIQGEMSHFGPSITFAIFGPLLMSSSGSTTLLNAHDALEKIVPQEIDTYSVNLDQMGTILNIDLLQEIQKELSIAIQAIIQKKQEAENTVKREEAKSRIVPKLKKRVEENRV